MRVEIGDRDSQAVLGELTVTFAGELSDAARDALIAEGGQTIRLPWDLLLLALELFEDDDERSTELQRLVPTWIEETDLDEVLAVVLQLRLPVPTDLQLRLRARGTAGRPGYALETEWVAPHGRRADVEPEVAGGVITVDGDQPRRLTLGQYRLLTALDDLPPLGAERSADLLATDRLRSVVPEGDSGVVLDPFLARETVLEVSKVAPTLVQVDGGFQVRPRVNDLPADDVENYFYRGRDRDPRSPVLRVSKGAGKRTRAVFAKSARQGLAKIRKLDVLTPQEAAHAYSHPEEVFGADLDLTDLSERVAGLGPPVRRVLPMLREIEQQDWWDWDVEGVLLDADGTSAPSISFKSAGVRAALRAAIEHADASGDTVIPHPDGDGFIELTPKFRKAVASADAIANEEAKTGRLKGRPTEVLLVRENLESLQFDRSGDAPLQRLSGLGRPPGLRPGAELAAHQQEGFEWLASLLSRDAESSWRGALLADDMGLGKTIQALSFLAWLRATGDSGPHLVVAPVALLDNWQREAQRFFGVELEPILVAKGADLPANPVVAAKRLEQQHVVLVSYETLRRKEAVFARAHWDAMILDEAQKAKNPGSQIARVVRVINARRRIAMSGTPVENTLAELWALYDWAVPGLLGTLRDFVGDRVRPIKSGEPEVVADVASKLHSEIEPYFIRRMKTEILDLPPLHKHRDEVPLNTEQEAKYAETLKADAPPLAKLLRLFAICAHPLLDGQAGELPSVEDMSFPKVERFFDIVDRAHERGEKVLVFANRRKVQRWLATQLEERFERKIDIINGQTTGSAARMRIIDRFQEATGFNAIVLAPRAAGLGLNITAANHVVHYTREWNPAIENQATDRAYRMGQEREVHVHTIISTSVRGRTAEEKLDALLEQKRQLMRDFVIPMGGFVVSPEELASEIG